MHLLRGGTYCMDLQEQERIISKLLTPNMQELLKKYTSEYYRKINRSMRDCVHPDENILKIINGMLAVFETTTPFVPSKYVTLWRGVKFQSREEFHRFLRRDKVVDLGFVSTSTDFAIAKSFADDDDGELVNAVVMKIYLMPQKSYKIIPVRRFSKMSFENEVIVQPKTVFYKVGENAYVMGGDGDDSAMDESLLTEARQHHQETLVMEEKMKQERLKIAMEVISKSGEEIIDEVIEETWFLNDIDCINESETHIDMMEYTETYAKILKAQYGVDVDINNKSVRKIVDDMFSKRLRTWCE
jgi:hypothetical protein